VTETTTSRVLRAAIAEPWAITEAGLELILSVAARENAPTIEALEAYRARHVPTAERLQARGPVAIIEAVGPMFRRANIFTAISGASSYDVMRRDLQAALDDPAIKAIVLNLDTPGGSVNGADELAKAIYAARSVKPVVAYVGGTGASAGYWLASQASEIVVSDAAIVGSIGVRALLTDTSEADKKAGRVEFISSQSPGKRADLASDEGRARVQRTVDALADVFVAAVAKGRGVNAKTVIERFGAGDVLVGAAAVKAGMADRIGSFEAVVAELAGGKTPRPSTGRRSGMQLSDDARAERARIKAILTDPAAKDRQDSAMHLAFETDMDAAGAVALLATLPAAAAKADPLAGLVTGPRAKDAPGGLVVVRPDQAHPTRPNAAASWGNVLARMSEGKA
jgi:signal peptide peptidase SppA